MLIAYTHHECDESSRKVLTEPQRKHMQQNVIANMGKVAAVAFITLCMTDVLFCLVSYAHRMAGPQATFSIMLLVLLVLLACGAPSVTAQNAEATVATQADAAASPSTVGSNTRARSFRIRQQNFTERHNMLTSLPDFKAVTYQEMLAEQVGGAVASVVPGSDSGDVDPQASGTAGANYADSRFGTGADYASFVTKATGRLRMRFGGSWYVCTASTINRALLVTAAHCVFGYGKKTAGWPDIVNGQYQVSLRTCQSCQKCHLHDGNDARRAKLQLQELLMPCIALQYATIIGASWF